MSPQASDFQKKTYVERRKIEVDRFFEGIHRQHDPRDDGNYDLDWVIKNAADFSVRWRNSACRTCEKVKECGFNLVPKCDNYSEDKNKS